jgi:hypothetical protein
MWPDDPCARALRGQDHAQTGERAQTRKKSRKPHPHPGTIDGPAPGLDADLCLLGTAYGGRWSAFALFANLTPSIARRSFVKKLLLLLVLVALGAVIAKKVRDAQ